MSYYNLGPANSMSAITDLASFIGNVCGLAGQTEEKAMALSGTFGADIRSHITPQTVEDLAGGNMGPMRKALLTFYLRSATRAVEVLTDALDRLEREEVPG